MGLIRKQKLKPTDVLKAILAVDGPGSRIDADMVDGKHAEDIIDGAMEQVSTITSYTAAENKIPMGKGTNGKLDGSWLDLSNYYNKTEIDNKITESGNAEAVQSNLTAHINDKNNPHQVTAVQVGAIPTAEKGVANGVAILGSDGKVPQSQLPEMNYDPAGSAAGVQTNLTTHKNDKNNPHQVTASQIGAATVEYVDEKVKNISSCKIQTISYTGNGKYGVNNPVTFTFEFVPQIILCQGYCDVKDGYYHPLNGSYFDYTLIPASWLTTDWKSMGGVAGPRIKKSTDGKTISLYDEDNAHQQLNIVDRTYYIAAIG